MMSFLIPDILLEVFRVIIGSKTLVYSLYNGEDLRNKAKKRKAYKSVNGSKKLPNQGQWQLWVAVFSPTLRGDITVHVIAMLKATRRDSTRELKRTKQSIWSCQSPLHSSHCVSKLGVNIITETVTVTLELETYHTNSSYLQWRRIYFLKDRLSFLKTNQESECASLFPMNKIRDTSLRMVSVVSGLGSFTRRPSLTHALNPPCTK